MVSVPVARLVWAGGCFSSMSLRLWDSGKACCGCIRSTAVSTRYVKYIPYVYRYSNCSAWGISPLTMRPLNQVPHVVNVHIWLDSRRSFRARSSTRQRISSTGASLLAELPGNGRSAGGKGHLDSAGGFCGRPKASAASTPNRSPLIGLGFFIYPAAAFVAGEVTA
ncbi:hypothetical protein F5144DRAFT_265110 [Chaetomium tenue]|uniref:Uncharacterized protein n=1 Tax=Chaetomium tenue TaxID=1854479 RepID=A0ACB7PBN3_9PEZI|nr:hypothetical protein F5144DRAFT_265110 [Chaetomium globosum]